MVSLTLPDVENSIYNLLNSRSSHLVYFIRLTNNLIVALNLLLMNKIK